ncbi:ABC transporter ATP-binding protein [Thauera linaloolentis]|uniref:Iron(III) dicitrate transport ATP-binding protein fecE n=1 Tax=Thauera linaloolentis (strain DSM 12138 / JCM 21573 / CCUG 41526 / CIP 105981 / IAM 15112 / NBRC 102519 / 47Lol) TaxID=1123367 RepID=N6Z4B1_THAL4|nr:ABC transporter ATP-binding protein [Thauera linaloolentis]ENO86964.1 iron(III) dicitrate transport ATP-binding protein fecE [Thauera linaloolentis 47Lol = DSM 12138]MCM8564423.1 ABC transporter ATP-binding protein [Thauera linaloolentis]
MKLQARELRWQVPHSGTARSIVEDVSLHVAEGELVGLIGPNGSGKSTVLRMIYRILRPAAGAVSVDGRDVWRMSARDTARLMAVLAQENGGEFEFSVREVVSMGRTPHKSAFARDDQRDIDIVHAAMLRVGVLQLAERSFATLSGGEKQRVLMARALAQQAGLLVLDEPTNHLDVRYQFEIMNLVRSLGVTAIAALHELHIAAHYCDRLYLLENGRLAASGTPAEVLTAEHIAGVYGVRAAIRLHPRSGRPHIEFMPDEPV